MGTVNSAISPWAASGTITENEARLAMGAGWAKAAGSAILTETGVVESAGPTATASGTNCTVTAHQAIVEDANGTWVCTATTSLTCPLDAVPASGQSRYDLIVGEVASGVYRLRSVSGTPASSPTIPAVPSNVTPLFRVQVTNAGAQTPVPIFSWTRAPGGIRLCEAGDVRPGAFQGDMRRFRSGQIDVWTGSAWVAVVAPAAWTQFTPTLFSAAGAMNLGSTGSAIGRYMIAGKSMNLRYVFRSSGSGAAHGYGDVYTQLPPGFTSAPSEETQILAKLNAYWPLTTLNAIYLGKCFIPPNSNRMNLFFPVSRSDCSLTTYQTYATSAGTLGSGHPLVTSGAPLPGIVVIQGTIEIS